MAYYLQVGGTEAGAVLAPAKYLNRHGLITGATGTGKSVSVIGLVEAFQRLGVPSIVPDVKGDLSGMAKPSTGDPLKAQQRNAMPWQAEAAEVQFWDAFGLTGVPLNASVQRMGAPLFAQALGLTDTQTGVLEIAFAVAEDEKRPLDTLDDLRALVTYCAESRRTIGRRYGLVTPSSVAAIGRAILRLERAGGGSFFSREFTPIGIFTTGRAVRMLDCVQLVKEPRLYGAVLLWLLNSLYDTLPEVGDLPIPTLAIFFDEGHLIFDECSPEVERLLDRTVRLIRSKGVCVFFASQAPGDFPDSISRQLHLRIQHALRAVTPKDRAMVKGAADSLPPGEGFNPASVIEKLKTGQALVTYLDENGQSVPTQIVDMAMPRCRLTPLTPTERKELMNRFDLEQFNLLDGSKPCATEAKPRTQWVETPPVKLHFLERVGAWIGYSATAALTYYGFKMLAIGWVGVGSGLLGGALFLGLNVAAAVKLRKTPTE